MTCGAFCAGYFFPQFSHIIVAPHNWFAGWRLFQSIMTCVSSGIGRTWILSPIWNTAFRPAILINLASIVFFISFPFGCDVIVSGFYLLPLVPEIWNCRLCISTPFRYWSVGWFDNSVRIHGLGRCQNPPADIRRPSRILLRRLRVSVSMKIQPTSVFVFCIAALL